MRKIAVFEVEFDTEDMISDEDLEKLYDGSWYRCMLDAYENEGFGIFDKEIKLVEIKEIVK